MQDFDTILHAFATMFEHQSALELKPMYSSKNPVSPAALRCAALPFPCLNANAVQPVLYQWPGHVWDLSSSWFDFMAAHL